MKGAGKYVALLAAWLVYLGFAGPALISSPDSFAVICGFLGIGVLVWVTVHMARNEKPDGTGGGRPKDKKKEQVK